jgi:hypothetical protein
VPPVVLVRELGEELGQRPHDDRGLVRGHAARG